MPVLRPAADACPSCPPSHPLAARAHYPDPFTSSRLPLPFHIPLIRNFYCLSSCIFLLASHQRNWPVVTRHPFFLPSRSSRVNSRVRFLTSANKANFLPSSYDRDNGPHHQTLSKAPVRHIYPSQHLLSAFTPFVSQHLPSLLITHSTYPRKPLSPVLSPQRPHTTSSFSRGDTRLTRGRALGFVDGKQLCLERYLRYTFKGHDRRGDCKGI